jgi:hypothetical protein
MDNALAHQTRVFEPSDWNVHKAASHAKGSKFVRLPAWKNKLFDAI